jgi:hypothetical protein
MNNRFVASGKTTEISFRDASSLSSVKIKIPKFVFFAVVCYASRCSWPPADVCPLSLE